MKIRQWFAELEPALGDLILSDRTLVITCTFLQHRDGLSDCPISFKVPQHYDTVSQKAHINRVLHRANQALLPDDQDANYTVSIQVREQLVKLHRKKPFLWCRHQVPIHAVNDHDTRAIILDLAADHVRELARSKLGKLDLAQCDASRIYMLLYVQSKC